MSQPRLQRKTETSFPLIKRMNQVSVSVSSPLSVRLVFEGIPFGKWVTFTHHAALNWMLCIRSHHTDQHFTPTAFLKYLPQSLASVLLKSLYKNKSYQSFSFIISKTLLAKLNIFNTMATWSGLWLTHPAPFQSTGLANLLPRTNGPRRRKELIN